jgi:hypothetical protein
MEKLILKDIHSTDELKYYWGFTKGILSSRCCEVGIVCGGREVTEKGYERQLCLLYIEETRKNIVLKNINKICFAEAESRWGTVDYILAYCNGFTIWNPPDYRRYIQPGNTCYFNKESFVCTFEKKELIRIKKEISKKSKFLEKLLK